MKVYFGNLSYKTSADDLKSMLTDVGGVLSVNLIMDRQTGTSKGFAFVEFESSRQGSDAIKIFDTKDLNGRALKVSQAQERSNSRSSDRQRRW